MKSLLKHRMRNDMFTFFFFLDVGMLATTHSNISDLT